MASTILLSDNGVSSGTAGIKTTGGNDGTLQLQTTTSGGTATTAVTIDTSQNVGIGTSSPSFVVGSTGLQINGSSAPAVRLSSPTSNIEVLSATSASYVWVTSNTPLAFGTNATERARIDSSGNLLVGTTSAALSNGNGIKLLQGSSAQLGIVTNESLNNSHYHHYNTNATYNGYRFYTLTNGGIANYSGNNSNLSDERTKTNIELSGDYLAKICAIPVKLFNYKDEQEGEQRTLGVIAQDVELVAPELVNNEGFGETPEGETPLKSIYTTDMMFALMKCIQEQQALITTLTERLSALEAK